MADIPASVLRDLPSDPAEVLAVSARLAAYAFSTKSAQCDAEVSQLRSLLLQRQTELRGAERRADELEAELAHARAEARRALGELDRAGAEKATLQDTVRALSKDVARLDHFRRNLLKTLNDDDYPAAAEPYGSHHHSSHNGGGGAPAAASPPPQGPPHPPGPPDGKAFFRAARARLSPEAYAQLLDNVKGLNARTRTRAQMLAAARQLFGAAHADLYDELERLIDDTLA